MPISSKNWKTYIIIDFYNNIYGFVNSSSDINDFFAANGINTSTLPRDVDNVLTDAVLVNVKTGEEIPIKYSVGSTLCI